MLASKTFQEGVDQMLQALNNSPGLDAGLGVANEIVQLLGLEAVSAETVRETMVILPNVSRYDSWFKQHPIFADGRACFALSGNDLIETKFYDLKKRSRQIIAGSVGFELNFEDENFTRQGDFKVGLDFFLTPDNKSLLVVLSNSGNLRLVELSEKLTNTQVDIFSEWQEAAKCSTKEDLHNLLWDSFKLQSVNQKFYDGIAKSFMTLLGHLKSIGKDEEQSKLFASRLLGRLLFCWFLRKKGIIDEAAGYFSDVDQFDKPEEYYRFRLEPLFFKTLNTPLEERFSRTNSSEDIIPKDVSTPYLNGGLFEVHDNDWYSDSDLTFPKDFFTSLYDHFDAFNFTTDESSLEYEQIAVDPEMLGRIFENFLAEQIDERTGQQARKAKGAYYTPREIVSYMCQESIRDYLLRNDPDNERYVEAVYKLLDVSDQQWAIAGTNSKRDNVPREYIEQILKRLDHLKILDPACGSGAFPMGILQLCLRIYERLVNGFDAYKTKLQIIQNNIFGSDIEPMAIEIARLRVWLSLVVDSKDNSKIQPLPNLNFNFVCANSLIPLKKNGGISSDMHLYEKLRSITERYFQIHGTKTKQKLQQEYYKHTKVKQMDLDGRRAEQLRSFDPFKNDAPADFFDTEYMFGIKEFDIVIGNPPYGIKLSDEHKTIFKAHYTSAKTENGYKGSTDTYILFTELGTTLLCQQGNLHYIVPMAIISSDASSSLHKFLECQASLIKVSSYADRPQQVFQNASVNSSIIFLRKDTDVHKNASWLATKMYKKHKEMSIDEIINSLQYQDVSSLKMNGRYPKISEDVERSILVKLRACNTTVKSLVQAEGAPIYYRSAGGRYFKTFTNYSTGSSAEKILYFDDKHASIVAASLSTSLFWWYYQIFSDNLNLKKYEIESFPVPINELIENNLADISDLYARYLLDIERKSEIRKAEGYPNIEKFKQYNLRQSFPLIDKLDDAIDKFYGLDKKEVDFIKNYERDFRDDKV